MSILVSYSDLKFLFFCGIDRSVGSVNVIWWQSRQVFLKFLIFEINLCLNAGENGLNAGQNVVDLLLGGESCFNLQWFSYFIRDSFHGSHSI